jgi:hypothetical protein
LTEVKKPKIWRQDTSRRLEVVFQDGFFGIERSKEAAWRWLGDGLPRGEGPLPLKGTVLLLNTKKDSILTIAAIVPAMPAPPRIKFFVNGEPLDEFTLASDRFEKSYKIPGDKRYVIYVVQSINQHPHLVSYLLHASSYYCLDTGGANLDNYEAGGHYFPVRFRPGIGRGRSSRQDFHG